MRRDLSALEGESAITRQASASASGELRAKGSSAEVQVAQSGKEIMLGLLPFLPTAAPKEAMAAMPEIVVVADPNHPSGSERVHGLMVETEALDTFSLDLRHPLSPLLAFAACLAAQDWE